MSNKLGKVSAKQQPFRVFLGGGNNANMTNSGYLKGFNGQPFASTLGWCLPFSGSIVAIGITLNCSSFTTTGVFNYGVHDDGSTIGQASFEISSATRYSDYAHFSSGQEWFEEGSILSPRIDYSGGLVATVTDLQLYALLELDQ